MIPITRKDHYLNEIVGWGNTAPEKPYIEEELFFAEILGEAVQAPEPLPRYQMYLAKIAGREIEIPYPEVRLEYFLARAAGMDITVPVPITREEIYWSNYTAIVEFEVEGVPPLTYKAIEGTLENYRIYGNTVGGESVGDRTGNLFDGEIMIGGLSDSTGSEVDGILTRLRTSWIKVEPSERYSFNLNNLDYKIRNIYIYNESKSLVYKSEISSNSATVTVSSLASYVRFVFRKNDGSETVTISDCREKFMFNTGSTPLPYEPYGYRVPVTVTNGTDTETTNIYLPEQIKMVGDEAEYIDFREQKQYFANGTSVDVTLPALPTLSGTNTLSVGTEVQPSKVYIKGEKEREHT